MPEVFLTRLVTLAFLGAATGCATTPSTPAGATAPEDDGAMNTEAMNAPDVLLGAQSRDWLIEPPPTFSAWGERILSSAPDSGLGVVVGRSPQNEVVLAIDHRHRVSDGAPRFEIKAVLRFASEVTDAQVAWDHCFEHGDPADLVVAQLGVSTSSCAVDPTTAATKAWRIRLNPPQFVETDAAAVRCRRQACNVVDDNAIMGGVMLDAVGPD